MSSRHWRIPMRLEAEEINPCCLVLPYLFPRRCRQLSLQIGHQLQTEGTSLPKSGLLNKRVYLGYVQGLEEGWPTRAQMTPKQPHHRRSPPGPGDAFSSTVPVNPSAFRVLWHPESTLYLLRSHAAGMEFLPHSWENGVRKV